MKRLLSIFKRDVKSSVREFLLLYIILAPIIIAIGLRFFIPSVNAISFQFALDKGLGKATIAEFQKYGKVELLDDRKAIEDRVGKVDDIIGVIQKQDNNYVVIAQGNENESTRVIAQQIIANMNNSELGAAITYSDIGAKMSAITIYGASSIILMAIVLAGMVIGLNIIEEKESNTMSALSVTPMRKLEFIAGKSFIGLFLPIIEALFAIWILNLQSVNIVMLLAMTFASSFIAIIFGFLIGVLSSNQISGIANMKFLLLFVSASFIGAVVLPAETHVFLYWSPLYWSTIGLIKVITNAATWLQIIQYTVWIMGLTALVFLLSAGKIKKGLT
ncbi:MAG TPA: ABC transporter permease [Patescibacteria group bacterium]|nr:ABC transporter permease [Patescibacteria group bacterium]